MIGTRQNISVLKVVFYAVSLEAFLILLQFTYVGIYNVLNIGATLSFDESYMKGVGFYIFQFIGFFAFILVAYHIFKRVSESGFSKGFALFVSAGLLELAFYFIIDARYQGAFLYSILSKAIAISIGGLINWISQSKYEVNNLHHQ